MIRPQKTGVLAWGYRKHKIVAAWAATHISTNIWCETGLESLIFHKSIPQLPQELPVIP